MVVLISGGLDSVVALHDCVRSYRVALGVSFDYGAKHNHREMPFARAHCEDLKVPHQVIRLPFINELFDSRLLKSGLSVPAGAYSASRTKLTSVPFRNGIMISIAAGLAESIGADGVVISAHSGRHSLYPDCRADFASAMREALKKGTYAKIELITPYIEVDKSEIVLRGSRLGVDFARTWSCYAGGKIHCGRCATCVERQAAFKSAGVIDPVAYES